jgi:hypothetical protein
MHHQVRVWTKLPEYSSLKKNQLFFSFEANSNNSTSPTSSLPTYGSHDYGIYKRLMRSVSNSLVSNPTFKTHVNQSEVNRLNKSFSETQNKDGRDANADPDNPCQICVSAKRTSSDLLNPFILFSSSSLAIIAIYDTKSEFRSYSVYLKTIKPEMSRPSAKLSFFQWCQLDLFSLRNFYEFFFSHLPVIECQIKELRSKLVGYLQSSIQSKFEKIRNEQYIRNQNSVFNVSCKAQVVSWEPKK